jgi:hypothetical protein
LEKSDEVISEQETKENVSGPDQKTQDGGQEGGVSNSQSYSTTGQTTSTSPIQTGAPATPTQNSATDPPAVKKNENEEPPK